MHVLVLVLFLATIVSLFIAYFGAMFHVLRMCIAGSVGVAYFAVLVFLLLITSSVLTIVLLLVLGIGTLFLLYYMLRMADDNPDNIVFGKKF